MIKINNINFYKSKQKWKYALFILAIIISSLSIILTSELEKSLEESISSLSQSIETLKREESENMDNFAKAIQHLNNMDPDVEGDYSFSMEIVKQNVRIPLILIDECNDVLQSRNLNIPEYIENDSDDKAAYISDMLDTMKAIGDSIYIDVFGEKQILYYKNSDILNQTSKMQEFTEEIYREMKWYPLFQLLFILLFFLLSYFIFNAARRSEQNQVWAGMAKETAHQIGTPLSSMIAWVELLKLDKKNESMTIEMEKDLERLKTITERFSKIGSKTELIEENIETILSKSLSYMEKRFSKKIKFHKNLNLVNKNLKINKVLFIWAIENICKNAADAMKGEGLISIDCTENESNINILISDTGKGIDKSIQKSIFLPGITSKKRGWGLGLSLAKRIIEEHHKGKIFVKKSNKQEGTTFCLVLPK